MSMTIEYATAFVRDFFVPVYANEHPLTKGVIASIPADKAGYAPDAVTRPAIDLAWHIVSAEIRFMKAVASGAFDYGNATRPAREGDRLQRHLQPPRIRVSSVGHQPHDSSSWPVDDVPQADGCACAVDLRGELRLASGAREWTEALARRRLLLVPGLLPSTFLSRRSLPFGGLCLMLRRRACVGRRRRGRLSRQYKRAGKE
jgi:hypothetical protein